MIQADITQEHAQAFRSVHKSQKPSTTSAPLDSDGITLIDCHTDPETHRAFILWEDIQQAFDEALLVRHKSKMLPFIKGPDYRPLEPRRIAAVLGVVLDVIVGGQSPSAEIVVLQRTIQDMSLDSPVLGPMDTRRSPENGFERQSMENYSFIGTTVQQPQVIEYFSKDEYTGQEYGQPTDVNKPQSLSSSPISPTRAPRSTEQDQQGDNSSVNSSPRIHNRRGSALRKQPQNPQDQAATTAAAKTEVMKTMARASQGEADAQFALGEMLKNGKGVRQDRRAAMDWYSKAAEQGHARAQYSIGHLYEQGDGAKQETLRNVRRYLEGVVRGYSEAEVEIAKVEDKERGVPQDDTKAFEWYRQSAERGYPAAQLKVARCYEEGRGVPKSREKAFEWFMKADSTGFIIALRANKVVE
ncbi:MAG: hypothetical protein J3R72DRAFT_529172 [Linnemannia gamsii]|nr:MAG: hypothetical protein J3R72DRAFT_529172 [Linnemannia gamsii]